MINFTRFFKMLLLASAALCMESTSVAQGTWKTLKNAAPDPNGGAAILLTDGTVMVLTSTGPGGIGDVWDLLTPVNGSYLNGTWTQLPKMHDTRLYCATQVLPDGNVYVAGGEYGTNAPDGYPGATGELYNTTAKTWTLISGVPNNWNMYDGNSELLYDGTVLQGCQISNDFFTTGLSADNLIWTESTNSYDSAAPCFGSHDEAAWVKLPDSSVINVDMGTENSERYIPQQKKWVTDATLPTYLYDLQLYEAGAGLMLPNGKLFFLSDSVNTAFYTPSGNATPGSWSLGPAMPSVSGTQLGCPDAPAAIMPNGIILCDFSPAGTYNNPTYFYEYNYLTNTFTQVSSPTGGNTLNNNSCYTNMLVLPDGTILFSQQGDNNYYQYTPKGSPIASGKPVINSVVDICPNFMITGKLFNGISEGAGFGDDWQVATNYPIVRLTKGTNVYYARTTNWNRIGAIMTDSLEDTAYFTIPSVPAGTYSVEVIANGIPSSPFSVTLPCTPLGLQTIVENNHMIVYPNPSTGLFTFESSQPIDRAILSVYNMMGEEVVNKEISGPVNQVDLTGRASGVYFYRVLSVEGAMLSTGKLTVK